MNNKFYIIKIDNILSQIASEALGGDINYVEL